MIAVIGKKAMSRRTAGSSGAEKSGVPKPEWTREVLSVHSGTGASNIVSLVFDALSTQNSIFTRSLVFEANDSSETGTR